MSKVTKEELDQLVEKVEELEAAVDKIKGAGGLIAFAAPLLITIWLAFRA
jgi:class 3 adenylate cyclase